MTQDRDINIGSDSLLQDTAKEICALAEKHRHDSLLLLSLLRDLEKIHRQIRVQYFETALPQTRNDLYQFVKDIEDKGGWPYIERMRLKDLLQNIELVDSASERKSDLNEHEDQ
ncbi:hypothetical protein IQ255_19715 [Pleurocapsales cyanobacterium LEGE 10410]|nr:hypothetical protein [Pleurocapsales cyanobacterium LEGE 10410]